MAKAVWSHFTAASHLVNTATSINQMAQVWLLNISLNNLSDISRNIIFATSLWEIWKQRNSIIFDSGVANYHDIICRVSTCLQHSLRAFKLANDQEREGPAARTPIYNLQRARWNPQREGLKLNISGREGPDSTTVGGGIIRGEDGCMVIGFYKCFRHGTPLIPEMDILLYGLHCCRNKNLHLTAIESSSNLLFKAFSNPTAIPWRSIYIFRKIKSLIPHHCRLLQVNAGANGVAKALASLALSSQEDQIFSHTSELPAQINQILRSDLLSIQPIL